MKWFMNAFRIAAFVNNSTEQHNCNKWDVFCVKSVWHQTNYLKRQCIQEIYFEESALLMLVDEKTMFK